MKQSRNWATIERLPERPGVAIMTGTGYWLNGAFHESKNTRVPVYKGVEPSRRPLLSRIFGWGVR